MNPLEHYFKIKTNIEAIEDPHYTEHDYKELPILFLDQSHQIVPKTWQLPLTEQAYLKNISITNEKARLLERDSTGLTKNKEWEFCNEGKIEALNAHRILIRKHNFDSLATKFLFPKQNDELPHGIRENIKYERSYQEQALEAYYNTMCFYLNHDVEIRETGFVIQPCLPWLVANPDALISDKCISGNNQLDILKLLCPRSRRNDNLDDIISDPSFFIEKSQEKFALKKNHDDGCFTQIQIEMGICGAIFCYVAVFVFNEMIIVIF